MLILTPGRRLARAWWTFWLLVIVGAAVYAVAPDVGPYLIAGLVLGWIAYRTWLAITRPQ